MLGTRLGAATLTAALDAEAVDGDALTVNNRVVKLPLMLPDVAEAEHALAEAEASLQRAREDQNITPYQLRQQYEGRVGWAKDYVQAARTSGNPTEPFAIQNRADWQFGTGELSGRDVCRLSVVLGRCFTLR